MEAEKAKEALPHTLFGFAAGVSAITNAISALWTQCRKPKPRDNTKEAPHEHPQSNTPAPGKRN